VDSPNAGRRIDTEGAVSGSVDYVERLNSLAAILEFALET
jgi:hypothetical protein